MGQRRCNDGHAFGVSSYVAGIRRKECSRCGTLVIDAAGDGLSAPGLFKRGGPTIFSVLGVETRSEKARHEGEKADTSGPVFAFGAGGRLRGW